MPHSIVTRSDLEFARSRVLFQLASARELRLTGADHRNTISLSAQPGLSRQLVWLRGNALATIAGRTVRLAPGTVWTPAQEDTIRVCANRDESSLGLDLVFTESLALDYLRFLVDCFGEILSLPLSVVIGVRRLCNANRSDPDGRVSHKIYRWFTSLHQEMEARRIRLADLAQGEVESLHPKIAQYGYSLKGLAAQLGHPPSYISGLLRRAWRKPAGQGLRELRHRYAIQLLSDTTLSLSEIASYCGFSSVSSFSTTFKRIQGKSPGRARGSLAHGPLAWSSLHRPALRKTAVLSRTGKDHDETPVVVSDGPYFQCDGGEVNWSYETPFDLSISGITDRIHWVYTLEGEAIFEIGHKTRIEVKPGMLIVYPKPLNGRWLTPSGQPWKRVWVSVCGRWATEALASLAQAHSWGAMLPASSKPVRLARQWVQTWNENRNNPSIMTSLSAYDWLLSWWRLLHSGRIKCVPLPDLHSAQSRSFSRRIKTITKYAQEIGYSRAHCSRKLAKQWKGGTPAQIVRRQRLAQAALELRQTRLSVTEIARRAQFASAGSFIPAFKREFGQTPLAYRLEQS